MVTKLLRVIYNLAKNGFLVGLEWETGDLILPCLEVLKFRASSVTRYLNPPVADRTGILLVVLDLTAGDLETFAMVPRNRLAM